MTDDEVKTFLTSPARTGKLGTVRADGRPHVAPIWYALDGDDIVFCTGKDSVKGQNMRHQPMVSVCVDDDKPPFSFVTFEGEATVSEEPAETLRWAIALAAKYMGADKADAIGKRNSGKDAILVRVRRRHVVAVSRLAE
jgi:PPOX class probable F420-dependent enzyme